MTVGPKIRQSIDDMKRMGFATQDITDILKKPDSIKFLGSDAQIESHKDTGFSELSAPIGSKTALCSIDGAKLVPSRSEKTNDKILICSLCGRRSFPSIEPIEYATRMKTVLGTRTRKGMSAKLSQSSNYVDVERDEVSRDVYKHRDSLFKKQTTATGDDAMLERLSGVSVVDSEEVKPI